MDCPFADLGLPDDSTEAEVKARWRTLASTLHPDRGGDPAEFDRLRKAYDAAVELAKQPRRCERCLGTGRVWQRNGFHNLSVRCPACLGGGRVDRTS